MDLHAHGRPIASVFDLLGAHEPALTGALGFTLARSDTLRDALVADALGHPATITGVTVEQRGGASHDRTDLELHSPDGPLVIYEAKRGWTLPTRTQLATYAQRRPDQIVVVTDCTDSYAHAAGLPTNVDGVPVTHRSWRHLLEIVRAHTSSVWTQGLVTYLEAHVATLQDTTSNVVFCVVVGPIIEFDGQHGREFVDAGWYFHPHAPGWPKSPPNYMGFRQSNTLFTIRHVEDYELVADLRDVADKVGIHHIDDTVSGPHFVYRLGPHIGPPAPLPTGHNYRSGQHHIPIDLLLTCATYKDALEAAKQRRASDRR